MPRTVRRLISTWQLVAKRSLANWRLLSSVVLGVLLASAIMSGTVIYFDALRELALENTLSKHSATDLDILVQGRRGPSSFEEYKRVSGAVDEQIDTRIDWMLRDRIRAGKSPTFFLTTPGNEAEAGEDNLRSYFAFLPRLKTHVTLLPGGRYPVEHQLNLPGPDTPLELEAVVPQAAAQALGIGVGDRLSAVPPWNATKPYVSVVVSGVFAKNDPSDEFWYLEQGVLDAAAGPAFQTAPFHLSETAYMELLGTSLETMDTTYGWLLAVEPGRLNARNSKTALANIDAVEGVLGSRLTGYRQITVLDEALREYDRRLFFSKLPMFIVLILIAVVILYYVSTLSSLMVEDRRSEVALLRSRGASSAQILTVFVLEGGTIAGIAILIGPLLAATSISLLGFTPAFFDLTDGGRLAVHISGGAFMLSVLGGGLSFVALMIPAVQASRIGVTRHRQEAARPTQTPAFQRYYGDVLLLLIGVFLFYQLTEQGSVVATRLFGELAVSQLLLVLPGLILVASAMVLLRLFPLVMNLTSRLVSSWLSVGLVLGVWQMARNPTHYARLALLLILTAGLGIFASSFGGTLERSFEERVLYATGGDIRVDGVRPRTTRGGGQFFRRAQFLPSRPDLVQSYEELAGVDRASPVLRSTGRDLTKFFGESFTMLAVDSESFEEVAWFRDDFARVSVDELLSSLQVSEPPEGIQLPEDARALSVRLKADRPHPTVRVSARIRDAAGRYSTHVLGTLGSRDWTLLEASLRFGSRESRETGVPLTLVSLRVDQASGGQTLQAGSILIDDVMVTTQRGERAVVESFEDANGWSPLKASQDAHADVLRASDVGFDGSASSVLFSWTGGRALTARGIFHGPGRSSLPVLVSESFIKATNHSRGQEIEVQVAGFLVPVQIVGTVKHFPTMTVPNEKYIVADLASLTRYTNLGTVTRRELLLNEIWLSTATSGVQREELLESLENISAYSSESVHDRAELLAQSEVDPLVEAGWRALLFIAFSAVLILSCLGFLVHAYVSFRNRQLQFALLRTVGFSMRQLTSMVWLEQALVIGAGMALGTWMGGRLGETIMPFLSHDDLGVEVVPPFVMNVNWGALLATYAAMVIVFGIISVGLVWLVRRISLQRILRLGEM